MDDTLKGDKVPELERICLESDVQLAELAQCHSLLSAALSTSVEVPASLRQRVVALANDAQRAQALSRRSAGSPAPDRLDIDEEDASAEQSANRAHSLRKDAPHVAHAHDLRPTGTGPTSREQLEKAHAGNGHAANEKGRGLVPAQPVAAPMVASGGESIRPTGLDLEGSHLAHEVPEYLRGRSRDGWLGPVAIGALVCVLALLVWQAVGSWSSVRDMFTIVPKDANESSSNTNSAEVSPNVPSRPINEASANESSTNETPSPVVPAAPADAAGTNKAGREPLANETLPERPAPPSLSPANVSVAQWLPLDATEMQAVLFGQSAGAELHRLTPSESIPAGSQLFVPSANRPKLSLAQGPQWQVCGMTHAILLKPETGADSVPVIDMRIGRAIFIGNQTGERVALATPAGTVQLRLKSGASVAVEVSYLPRAHGAITNRAAYAPTLSLAALEGEVSIEANQQSSLVSAGNRVNLQSGQLTAPEASPAPTWTDPSSERPVDLAAAADLHKRLNDQASVGDALVELAVHRRAETRALAAATLALLGSWDWVAQPKCSLSDVRDRSHWTALVDRTRQILAAHPESADHLLAVLEKLDAAQARWRLALWLGLDANQLQADGSKAILASLSSRPC